jgi:hypothetical protein
MPEDAIDIFCTTEDLDTNLQPGGISHVRLRFIKGVKGVSDDVGKGKDRRRGLNTPRASPALDANQNNKSGHAVVIIW